MSERPDIATRCGTAWEFGVEFTGAGSGDRCDAEWLRVMGLDALGCPVVEMPAVNRSALEKVAWPQAVTT